MRDVDITDALAPTSDQLDAVELVNPRTFTIDDGSRLGTREGKTVAEIRLVNFPRVWRPSKGMLDVLAKCWGTDGKVWVGRRVTLYCDPEVTFGKEKPGGVRISHLSHIDKARNVPIRARGVGKVMTWHVEPLPDAPAQVAPDPLAIAKTNLWAAWTNGHDADPAALAAAFTAKTGTQLADASPADLDAFAATLSESGGQE